MFMTPALSQSPQCKPLHAKPSFPPAPNAKQILDEIYESGGDAEVVGGYVILVSLLRTNDESFKLLKPLRAVKYLACSNCYIDGSGLENVAQMKRLEKLLMSENRTLRQDNFRHIAELPRLRILDLEETNIDDQGIRYIAKITTLEQLYLTDTPITDKSIPELAKLTHLKILSISGTKMTEVGKQRLKRVLPRAFEPGPLR